MRSAEGQSRTSSNPAGVLIAEQGSPKSGPRAFAGAPPTRTASLLYLGAIWPLSTLATWILVLAWVVFSVALGILVGRFIRFGDRSWPR